MFGTQQVRQSLRFRMAKSELKNPGKGRRLKFWSGTHADIPPGISSTECSQWFILWRMIFLNWHSLPKTKRCSPGFWFFNVDSVEGKACCSWYFRSLFTKLDFRGGALICVVWTEGTVLWEFYSVEARLLKMTPVQEDAGSFDLAMVSIFVTLSETSPLPCSLKPFSPICKLYLKHQNVQPTQGVVKAWVYNYVQRVVGFFPAWYFIGTAAKQLHRFAHEHENKWFNAAWFWIAAGKEWLLGKDGSKEMQKGRDSSSSSHEWCEYCKTKLNASDSFIGIRVAAFERVFEKKKWMWQ